MLILVQQYGQKVSSDIQPYFWGPKFRMFRGTIVMPLFLFDILIVSINVSTQYALSPFFSATSVSWNIDFSCCFYILLLINFHQSSKVYLFRSLNIKLNSVKISILSNLLFLTLVVLFPLVTSTICLILRITNYMCNRVSHAFMYLFDIQFLSRLSFVLNETILLYLKCN